MRMTRTGLAWGLACLVNHSLLASAPQDSGIEMTTLQRQATTSSLARHAAKDAHEPVNGSIRTAAHSSAEPTFNDGPSSEPGYARGPSSDVYFGSSASDSLFNYQSMSRYRPQQWHLMPQSPFGLNFGGFTSIGYHTDGLGSSLYLMPNRVHLEQQWFYAEKIADGRQGLGLGGRIDYVYGSNAQFFQAAGLGTNGWDNSFDNGFPYGHALPQAYGEAAYGDFSVKVGHFLKITGFEAVQANKNFFNSRQLSFANLPFNHSGALTEYRVNSDTTLLNGYVMGLSTAFEDGGDAYIGGISHRWNDRTNFTYTTVLGRLYENLGGFGGRDVGQIHSLILSNALTDRLSFVNETNLYIAKSNGGTGEMVSNTSYFFYDVSERLALGSRSEYFHVTDVFDDSSDIFTQTLGVNVKPSSNLSIRPEVRWVFDPAPLGINGGPDTSNTIFGIDAIFVF
ncbi:MAG: outer membrane beta-barrel protein [Planctomycetaceae bacterium]|nr:outer membrane beta-barrel protein [Planctomycetaceae bacterium]